MGSKHASAPRQGSCPDVAYRPYKVYNDGVWSVDIELIADWLASLDDDSREQVVAAIELLEDRGPQLGRPIVDTVTSSRHRNIEGTPAGIVWAFRVADPIRLRSQASSDHADRR